VKQNYDTVYAGTSVILAQNDYEGYSCLTAAATTEAELNSEINQIKTANGVKITKYTNR
jgi:hypothetical protein